MNVNRVPYGKLVQMIKDAACEYSYEDADISVQFVSGYAEALAEVVTNLKDVPSSEFLLMTIFESLVLKSEFGGIDAPMDALGTMSKMITAKIVTASETAPQRSEG